MSGNTIKIKTVRASLAGHTFHERWAARRALQLVFPKDSLFAVAVEGLSTSETARPGTDAEEIADLVLYHGQGETFDTCTELETIQFKYKATTKPVTASYLKKTLKKFADTVLGYEREFSCEVVDEKLSFSFVTNAEFSENLWEAIDCIKYGKRPLDANAKRQCENLRKWCTERKVDPERLFSRTEFRASTKDLSAQNRKLRQTLSDWCARGDGQAAARLWGLVELVREKAVACIRESGPGFKLGLAPT